MLKDYTHTKIIPLSEELINQIAAGEVIESPASVIKELVENSIDAGAKTIRVDILGGGFHSIHVTDDGSGIRSEELPLALMRHATSKINSIDDLETLKTLGFRGEGLCSIASISRIKIISRTAEASMGAMISAEGGLVQKTAATVAPVGTSIEVNSLFYNVPARRKFQKSPASSTSEISRQMIKLALGNPEIRFVFSSNERTLMDLEPHCLEKLSERLSHVVSDIQSDQLKWIDLTGPWGRLYGFLGDPSTARKTRSGQYFFIHNRAVTSFSISSAVKESYATTIDIASHPVFILYLEPKEKSVDFNVHPQKLHVRFADEKELCKWITTAIFENQQHNAAPLFEKTFSAPYQNSFDRSFKEEPAREYEQPLIIHYRAKGLYFETPFLLFESHHAGSRALYIADVEKICAPTLSSKEQEFYLQQLLQPFYLSCENPHDSSIEALPSKGVGARPFGEKTVVIDSLAPWLTPEWVSDNFETLLLHPHLLQKKSSGKTLQMTMEQAESLIDLCLQKEITGGWKKVTSQHLKGLFHA